MIIFHIRNDINKIYPMRLHVPLYSHQGCAEGEKWKKKKKKKTTTKKKKKKQQKNKKIKRENMKIKLHVIQSWSWTSTKHHENMPI